jgi:hypothetical protein
MGLGFAHFAGLLLDIVFTAMNGSRTTKVRPEEGGLVDTDSPGAPLSLGFGLKTPLESNQSHLNFSSSFFFSPRRLS